MIHENGATQHISGERRDFLEASEAEVDRSAIGELHATEANLHRTAVRSLSAQEVEVSQSAIASLSVERGTVKQSVAGVVVGRGIACDQVRTGILAAPVVRGEVHTWLDLRTAVAIGVGMALGRALLGVIALLGRKAFR